MSLGEQHPLPWPRLQLPQSPTGLPFGVFRRCRTDASTGRTCHAGSEQRLAGRIPLRLFRRPCAGAGRVRVPAPPSRLRPELPTPEDEPAETAPNLRPRRSVRVGGCDFAADPASQADPAPIIWMPEHNPRLALLTEAPALLPIGPTLDAARLREILAAPEGAYAELSASLTGHQVLVLGVTSPSVPVAIVVPLDRLFEDRVDAARQLWRALGSGTTATPPAFSAQRRRRLKLVLRALDADLAGVGYRDIALVLVRRTSTSRCGVADACAPQLHDSPRPRRPRPDARRLPASSPSRSPQTLTIAAGSHQLTTCVSGVPRLQK